MKMAVWIWNQETSREIYKLKSLTALFVKNWRARLEVFDERQKLIEKHCNRLKKVGERNE